MERNAFDLYKDEIEDWKKLRQEKCERVEAPPIPPEPIIRETTPPSLPLEPEILSERVRLDRAIRQDDVEKLCREDLGLSVSLCDERDRIRPAYCALLQAEGLGIRCMVLCCAKKLGGHQPSWCNRCGRLICQECLGFAVTDIAEMSEARDPHNICFDCVSQINNVSNSREITHTMYYLRSKTICADA